MRTRSQFSVAIAALGVLFCYAKLHAQNEEHVALTGVVRSAEEGPMEGVLVSARKTGSTMTVTVVTDSTGRYSFPRNRLEPGQNAFKIRAVGYDSDDPRALDIPPDKTVTADLKLH